jgi:hypothetical protein
MMKRRRVWWILCCICAMGATSLGHAAPPVGIVDAIFDFADGSGCISTEVFIFATQSDPVTAGAPAQLSFTFSQYDDCHQEPVASIADTVPMGAQDLHVNEQLGSARLNTALQLTDMYSDKPVNVVLNLTWNSSEQPVTNQITEHMRRPGDFVLLPQPLSRSDRSAAAEGFVVVGNSRFNLKTVFADIASVE